MTYDDWKTRDDTPQDEPGEDVCSACNGTGWYEESYVNTDLDIVDTTMVQCTECMGEWDGQPDEAQEWHDFDPDC